jgi:hypothetical protein
MMLSKTKESGLWTWLPIIWNDDLWNIITPASMCLSKSLVFALWMTLAGLFERRRSRASRMGLGVIRIGLEAGPLSQWLYAAMKEAGHSVVLETRHVRDAFKAMLDCKSPATQEVRAC